MLDAREERVRALLPLVRSIARRIKRLVPSMDVDDLIGDGSVGLIRAVDSFDPLRGTSLEHYARRLISGSMLNGIRRMDPVPERARRKIRECESRRYEIAQERGSLPSDRDMDSMRPGYWRANAIAHRIVPLSLDAPLPDDERLRLDFSVDPATIVANREIQDALHRGMEALPSRQRDVLIYHYYRQRSLREVGERMSISAQRVSQLHLAAIVRLRRSYDVTPA